MRRIVDCVMKVAEEMANNMRSQQSLGTVCVYTCNLIEEIRVVDGYSICSGKNRLLLDRLKDVSGKGLFCVSERRV